MKVNFIKLHEVEIQRQNVTPRQFWSYCKREIERRTGGALNLSDWLDNFGDWKKPTCESKWHKDNHESWGEDARTEVIRYEPFGCQWYLQGSYNFIMEFDFYDEKTGFGYLYMCDMEEVPTEPEEPTEEEQQTEPETATTNEEEIEMSANYNYLEETKAAVLDFVAENVNREDWTGDRDGLENHLHDECWIDDSVTGNASGSYFCNSCKAAEALNGNLDLLAEALEDFGSEAADYKRALTEPEWADVTIRCYILGRAVYEVCEMLEESGYFEESEADESDIIAAVAAEIKTA